MNEDYPKIIEKTQAVFNQDNGTGRVVELNGQGFLHSQKFLTRWLSAVPNNISKHIKTEFPGLPGGDGSDYASFVAAGIPAFSLSSLSWDYSRFTWHTNLDTYDKIVFDALLQKTGARIAGEVPRSQKSSAKSTRLA